jgi:hypothetical protein
MNTDLLTDPVVKAAITALNAGDRAGWFDVFAADATLTDDGSPADFRHWSDSELFGYSRGYVTDVERVEEDARTLYARFHSDKWGDFRTFLKFEIAGGKITRLDVGQAE